MLDRAKRASHIDPPASSYAIMRRARPYRGENPVPGKDVRGELDPTPGIRELTKKSRTGILALISTLNGKRVDAPIFAGTGASTLTIGPCGDARMPMANLHSAIEPATIPRLLSERRRPEPGVGVGGCLRSSHRLNARNGPWLHLE
jgi:hypothetical protein